MTKRILAVLLLACSPALADTYYLRDTTGEACGSGTRRDLSTTAGTATLTTSIVSATTWNIVPGAGDYASGTWTNNIKVQVGSGGGPANRVTCTVARYNSGCTLQETMVSAESGTMTKGTVCGTDAESINTTGSPGAVTFAATDILVIECSRTNGNKSIDTCYDGNSGDYNSNLTTPTFTPAAAGRSRRMF